MTPGVEIVLAAHGGGDGSEANAIVQCCARLLGRRVCGARVRAAFVAGIPSWREVLVCTRRAPTLVIPLLASDGYYAQLLRRDVSSSCDHALVSAPMGTSAVLVQAVVERVTHAVAALQADVRSPRVVVVGHGTRRHAASADTTHAVADSVARQSGCETSVAFLDQPPWLEDVVAEASSAHPLIVAPFLMGGGAHVSRDVPARVANARRGAGADAGVVVLAPLGDVGVLLTALLAIVRESGLLATTPVAQMAPVRVAAPERSALAPNHLVLVSGAR